MNFKDLRGYIAYLEAHGLLKRITHPVDPHYEITEISDRTLRAGGPALLFENPVGYDMPVLTNLFGTPQRVAIGMGREDVAELHDVGELLAYLKEPEPPKGLKELVNKLPVFKQVLNMPAKTLRKAPCQEVVWQGDDVDLDRIPIMSCWPGDVAPLMTWGLTVTRGPNKKRQNIGIYRQQKLGKNKIIMRWLAHRGGALDLRDWKEKNPGKPFPVSVAFGADPATILAAVTPIPDGLSEYAFAGLLRGSRTEVVKSLSNDLQIPASAELVLEGYIDPDEFADEGPYGDHTGYFNEVDRHNVFTITHISMRKDAIYHSTYTGRPPDEPAVLGVALNEVFVPILQKQFPEITDFYLPPEGCSYRLAVVTIRKEYPGHAKRVMMGVWSFLRQFMYTKYVIVCDSSVNARDWNAVTRAMTQTMRPARDCLLIEDTPIDSLDFASPVSGLGSKMAFDATIKWPAELAGDKQSPAVNAWNPDIAAEDIKRLHERVRDVYFPPATDHGVLLVNMEKDAAGQSEQVLSAIQSYLKPYHELKFIILCDTDVNLRDWKDVIWAITTRMDPARDSQSVVTQTQQTARLLMDATNKFPGEVQREWGIPIKKNPHVVAKVDAIWDKLNIL